MKVSFGGVAFHGWEQLPAMLLQAEDFQNGDRDGLALAMDIWLRAVLADRYRNNINFFTSKEESVSETLGVMIMWADACDGEFVFGITHGDDEQMKSTPWVEVAFHKKNESVLYPVMRMIPQNIICVFDKAAVAFKVQIFAPV